MATSTKTDTHNPVFDKRLLNRPTTGGPYPWTEIKATSERLEVYFKFDYRLVYVKRISGFDISVNVYSEWDRACNSAAPDWVSTRLCYNLDPTEEVRSFWHLAERLMRDEADRKFNASIKAEMEELRNVAEGRG